MRVEADLAWRVVSRPAATIALACALALAGFACPTDTAVAAVSAGQGGAQAPPRGSSNDEGAGGESSGEGSGWTQVPAEAGGAPASGSAGAAAATGAPAALAGAPIGGEPSPGATPTEAPPPYEVG